MAVANEPHEQLLSVREAAAVCHVGPRTIRRRLAAGAFPNACKSTGEAAASGDRWRVPLGDLHRAGFGSPNGTQCDADAQPLDAPRESDTTAYLRDELAESVLAAELALMTEKMERWRAIAFERERALDRANATIATLSDAVRTLARADEPDETPIVAWPPPPRLADVPSDVRDAATQYAQVPPVGPRRWWSGR